MARVHVFMAMSLGGFIAGPNDELDWLHRDGVEDTFTPFFAQVGALLMGRRTYDVVRGFACRGRAAPRAAARGLARAGLVQLRYVPLGEPRR